MPPPPPGPVGLRPVMRQLGRKAVTPADVFFRPGPPPREDNSPVQKPPTQDVTQLLLAWNGGDQAALARLMPLVHTELHRLARRYLRGERADHTLQTTALVNEAYLRLVDARQVRWQNRAHFFAVS